MMHFVLKFEIIFMAMQPIVTVVERFRLFFTGLVHFALQLIKKKETILKI